MRKQNRKMPTTKAIRKHWADWLVDQGKFDSVGEVLEDNYCFACGLKHTKMERCHIVARNNGGSDSVDNLHVLCSTCHKDSERMEGEVYMLWFGERALLDMVYSAAVRGGFNIWSELSKATAEDAR